MTIRFPLLRWKTYVILVARSNCVKPFDFKDLMAFGMFILALLTFVFTYSS